MRDASRNAETAIWAAGFSLYELHLLAAMAAVARADMKAQTIEIVLREAGRFARDGIVVTGSRLGRDRSGARVTFGEGLAGRAMETGRTTLEGLAAAVPVMGEGEIVGRRAGGRGGLAGPVPGRAAGAVRRRRRT